MQNRKYTNTSEELIIYRSDFIENKKSLEININKDKRRYLNYFHLYMKAIAI